MKAVFKCSLQQSNIQINSRFIYDNVSICHEVCSYVIQRAKVNTSTKINVHSFLFSTKKYVIFVSKLKEIEKYKYICAKVN